MRHLGPMAYRQLSIEERYEIAALRKQGCSSAAIAATLGRHPSTIAREVKRNATPYDGAYRPNVAVEMTNGRRRRSRRNTRYGPAHYEEVEARLREEWSPEQIVGRFRRENRQVMSRETIYLHIWADKSRGGTLWRHLRGAQKRRRKRYRSRATDGQEADRRTSRSSGNPGTLRRLGGRHGARARESLCGDSGGA